MGLFTKVQTAHGGTIPSRGMEPKIRGGILPDWDSKMAWKFAFLALPFGFLWFRLLDNLRLEWATDPQYGYGRVVPLLCLGLMFRSWQRQEDAPSFKNESSAGDRSDFNFGAMVAVAFVILAFLYLPTRLVEAATPEWRPIQWLLGIEAIGLTLCAIYLGRGTGALRMVAFPICFFLVAIPWPTLIETPIIQGLSRFNASMVVQLLGWLGVPAIQHGNLIEVSTGVVGIDDACSGIRSFQSSLMISLFWGEYYHLRRAARLLLVPISFLLAVAFNICRTSILTFIAAKQGTGAIARYHGGTGLTILLGCFAITWCVALVLKRRDRGRQVANSRAGEGGAGNFKQEFVGGFTVLKRFAVGLLVWLVAVEIGVQAWYHILESQLKPGPGWSVAFPVENPSFKALPIPEKTRFLLRFDDGRQGQWSEPDGTTWQAFYFNWLPGRVAGYLAKRHAPEICLPAAGVSLRSGPELTMLNVHGVPLPMRSYVFESPSGRLNVYQCRWEAGASQEAYVAEDSGRYNLIRSVWTGRGKQGQKVLEIIVSGIADPAEAKMALVKELDKLIKVDTIPAQARAGILPEPNS